MNKPSLSETSSEHYGCILEEALRLYRAIEYSGPTGLEVQAAWLAFSKYCTEVGLRFGECEQVVLS